MSYRIVLTAEAKQLLTGIQDRREQGIILARLEQLAESPEQQGKPLRGGLAGYRSIRAIDQRYRIIYRVVSIELYLSSCRGAGPGCRCGDGAT
jgi:mRNA interferase RelE/StbE